MRSITKILYRLFIVLVIIFSFVPVAFDLISRFSNINPEEYLSDQLILVLIVSGLVAAFLLGIILNIKKPFSIITWKEILWKSVIFGILFFILPIIITSNPAYSGVTSDYMKANADNVGFALIQILLILLSYFVVAPLLISFVQLLVKRRKKEVILFLKALLFTVAFCGAFFGIGRGIYKTVNYLIKTDFVEINGDIVVPRQFDNKVVVSHTYGPAFKCLYGKSFKYRILDFFVGNFSTFVQKSVYLNKDTCTFIVIDPLYDFQAKEDIKDAAIVSEVLIRSFYGKYIVDWEKNTYKTVDVINDGEEYFRNLHADGYYYENTIKLKNGTSYILQTLIHEQLHAFSDVKADSHRSGGAGLEEAVTQLITNKIMIQIVPGYKSEVYENHLVALHELMNYIDEESVVTNYFSNNLWSLEDEVDMRTYDGAFCSFNHYLDWAQQELIIENNLEKAKEMANKASLSLKDSSLNVGYCRY